MSAYIVHPISNKSGRVIEDESMVFTADEYGSDAAALAAATADYEDMVARDGKSDMWTWEMLRFATA